MEVLRKILRFKHNFQKGEFVLVDKRIFGEIKELYGDKWNDVAYVDTLDWAGDVKIDRLKKINS